MGDLIAETGWRQHPGRLQTRLLVGQDEGAGLEGLRFFRPTRPVEMCVSSGNGAKNTVPAIGSASMRTLFGGFDSGSRASKADSARTAAWASPSNTREDRHEILRGTHCRRPSGMAGPGQARSLPPMAREGPVGLGAGSARTPDHFPPKRPSARRRIGSRLERDRRRGFRPPCLARSFCGPARTGSRRPAPGARLRSWPNGRLRPRPGPWDRRRRRWPGPQAAGQGPGPPD